MTDTSERRAGTEGWQLDGNSAEAYERYLVPGMFEPWADALVETAALGADARVLDVGCGTGVVARRATAELDDTADVVGVDTNEGMLEVARDASADLRPTIEWRRADAADLPFPDASFDVVLSQQALQFVPDPAAALREMRRVLAPDGTVALSVWRPIEFHPSYATFADALERDVGADAAAMMRSPFPTWDRAELRSLLEAAGFGSSTISIDIGSMRYPSPEEFVRREAASSPLAGPLGSMADGAREALVDDVREGLRSYADDRGIVFPMESWVVSARR